MELNTQWIEKENIRVRPQLLTFNRKQGYEVFGVLEDSPYDGAKQYFLKKVLKSQSISSSQKETTGNS